MAGVICLGYGIYTGKVGEIDRVEAALAVSRELVDRERIAAERIAVELQAERDRTDALTAEVIRLIQQPGQPAEPERWEY